MLRPGTSVAAASRIGFAGRPKGNDKRDKDWPSRSSARRSFGALIAALAISGCATTHSYTPVPCLTQSQYNDLKAKEPPKVHDQLNGDAAHDVGPLAGSAIRLRAYSEGLLTVLGGCTGPSK